jgi:hypothetical protein
MASCALKQMKISPSFINSDPENVLILFTGYNKKVIAGMWP